MRFDDDVLKQEVDLVFEQCDMNQDDVLCPEEAEEFIVEWCKQELGISRPRQSVVQRTFDKID